MRIEYHRTLIADRVRNDAFYQALKDVIVPGVTTVADIGTGTGLLGLMAAKLGAKAVYMFETAEVAGVAAKLIKANRAKACHMIPCHSTEFDDALSVDVIVSETLGNYALEENIIATITDANRRFLKPGGCVLPDRIRQYAAAVVTPKVDSELRAWESIGYGLDFGVAAVMSLNNVYVRSFAPDDLLDAGRTAVIWDEVELTRAPRSSRKGRARWTIGKAQTVYGIAVWWEARISATITLSTGPAAPKTHWEQLYFPLLEPMNAKSEDRFEVSLRSRSSEADGTHLAWSASLTDRDGKPKARQSLDLDKGFLP